MSHLSKNHKWLREVIRAAWAASFQLANVFVLQLQQFIINIQSTKYFLQDEILLQHFVMCLEYQTLYSYLNIVTASCIET